MQKNKPDPAELKQQQTEKQLDSLSKSVAELSRQMVSLTKQINNLNRISKLKDRKISAIKSALRNAEMEIQRLSRSVKTR